MKRTLFLVLILSSFYCLGQNLDASELLINSTIQIISKRETIVNGTPKDIVSSGTGFYFVFKSSKGEVPVIITNRHVIEGASSNILNFKLTKPNGLPDYKNIQQTTINTATLKWILHPNKDVDLAALPIAPILNQYIKQNQKIFYVALNESLIPTDSVKNSLSAIEDIIMVGYPFGLRDITNDLPVVRRGITATPFYQNYNSQQEFLCDVPVYPGSSGSPIMIFNPSSFSDKKGNMYLKSRFYLLGINYATYTSNFTGKILPTQIISNSVQTAIPYNIGVIIKSERILEFKQLLLK